MIHRGIGIIILGSDNHGNWCTALSLLGHNLVGYAIQVTLSLRSQLTTTIRVPLHHVSSFQGLKSLLMC